MDFSFLELFIQEKNEIQIRSVSPQRWVNVASECGSDYIPTGERVSTNAKGLSQLLADGGDLLFLSNRKSESSEPSLVPDEWKKLAVKEALKRVPRDKAFIVKWLYNLIDKLQFPDTADKKLEQRKISLSTNSDEPSQSAIIDRQFGQAAISLLFEDMDDDVRPALTRVDSIIFHQAKRKKGGDSFQFIEETSPKASTSKPPVQDDDLPTKQTSKIRRPAYKIPLKKPGKSNLKAVGVQTDKNKPSYSVHIAEKEVVSIKSGDDNDSEDESSESQAKKEEVDKETQTKEKQD